MGCCISSSGHNHEAEQRRSVHGEPPTSPSPILEVETVKQVLLETKTNDKIKSMSPGNQGSKPQVLLPGKDDSEILSEVSEISQVCRYTESLSTATAQEKGTDDQRPPPSKRRAQVGGRGRGERMAAEKRGQVAPLENRNLKRKDVVEAPPRNESYEKAPAAAEPRSDGVQAEEAETLENPVVSLECFIFL